MFIIMIRLSTGNVNKQNTHKNSDTATEKGSHAYFIQSCFEKWRNEWKYRNIYYRQCILPTSENHFSSDEQFYFSRLIKKLNKQIKICEFITILMVKRLKIDRVFLAHAVFIRTTVFSLACVSLEKRPNETNDTNAFWKDAYLFMRIVAICFSKINLCSVHIKITANKFMRAFDTNRKVRSCTTTIHSIYKMSFYTKIFKIDRWGNAYWFEWGQCFCSGQLKPKKHEFKSQITKEIFVGKFTTDCFQM